jgi:hypothetical protein
MKDSFTRVQGFATAKVPKKIGPQQAPGALVVEGGGSRSGGSRAFVCASPRPPGSVKCELDRFAPFCQREREYAETLPKMLKR